MWFYCLLNHQTILLFVKPRDTEQEAKDNVCCHEGTTDINLMYMHCTHKSTILSAVELWSKPKARLWYWFAGVVCEKCLKMFECWWKCFYTFRKGGKGRQLLFLNINSYLLDIPLEISTYQKNNGAKKNYNIPGQNGSLSKFNSCFTLTGCHFLPGWHTNLYIALYFSYTQAFKLNRPQNELTIKILSCPRNGVLHFLIIGPFWVICCLKW